MDKFSFKDVLVTVAGLFITVFIAWVLILQQETIHQR